MIGKRASLGPHLRFGIADEVIYHVAAAFHTRSPKGAARTQHEHTRRLHNAVEPLSLCFEVFRGARNLLGHNVVTSRECPSAPWRCRFASPQFLVPPWRR